MANALVTTDWLAQNLHAPDVRVVDATWFLPSAGRDAKAEFAERHIPGAVFFDIDEIAEPDTGQPHTVPGPVRFSSKVRRLGLGDGLRIVVYDANGFCASARVWWMFRLMGHSEVQVLDGGLGKWLAEGREVDDRVMRPTERHFTPRQHSHLLRELDQMRGNLTRRREQVVDARSAGRFAGSEPEPRPGLRAGHIPGSMNVPYPGLLAADGTLRDAAELRRLFETAGVDLAAPVVTTCGSGVSAAVLSLALFQLGREDVALYDGSWSEWGSQPDTPVATGR